MTSLLKNQILKPLSRFAKNLSPDKLKLSALKGEGDLTNLELDEVALMELLDLPTWLLLKKAVCNKVSVKIQWTKLKSQPIVVNLDEVYVEIEALEEPRVVNSGPVPSYRVNSGKYGTMDRVLDGVKMTVNSVKIIFRAQAFKASVELSRLVVASKMPNWREADLKLTSIRDPARNAILLFKEVVWETTRIEADGLQDLQVTPVKLIANTSRIRITLKKRLSDCAILSSRLQLLLDDLLWVLTVSQLEAAVLFLKSLKKSILKSAQQSKATGEEKMKRQATATRPSETIQSRTPSSASLNMASVSPSASQAGTKATHVRRLFDYYDVPETSYHLYTGRVELHFCEEGQQGSCLSKNAVENGAIRLILFKINLDFYPFHKSDADRMHWPGYSDLSKNRDAWVTRIRQLYEQQKSKRAQRRQKQTDTQRPTQSQQRMQQPQRQPQSHMTRPSTTSQLNNAASSLPNGCGIGGGERHRALMESVFVVRLDDLQMTCVSTIRHRKSTAMIGSDKWNLRLPSETTTVFMDYTEYYYSDDSTDEVPPANMFCQLNPLHIRLDYETLVWLNAFYLNLSENLSELSALVPQTEGPPADMNIRLEAIMPKIIFPAEFDISGQPDRPSVLQLQASTLVLSNLIPGGPAEEGNRLPATVQNFTAVGEGFFTEAKMRKFPRRHSDMQIDWGAFQDRVFDIEPSEADTSVSIQPKPPAFLSRLRSQSSLTSFGDQLWFVYCDQVWLEFAGAKTSKRPLVFVEPVEVTLWCRLSSSPVTAVEQSNGSKVPAFDSLEVFLECSSPLSVRINHYQMLFLLRLSESMTRLSEQLSEDQVEILAKVSGKPVDASLQPVMKTAIALHFDELALTFVMPPLSESLPIRENSSLFQFTKKWSSTDNLPPNECEETTFKTIPTFEAGPLKPSVQIEERAPHVHKSSSSSALPPPALPQVRPGSNTPSSVTCVDLACCPPNASDSSDPGVSLSCGMIGQKQQLIPPNAVIGRSSPNQLPTRQSTPSPILRTTGGNRKGLTGTLNQSFNKLGTSFTRFGGKIKASVTSSGASSNHGEDDGSTDDWEHISITGSELSDSDDERLIALLSADLEVDVAQSGVEQGMPILFGGVSGGGMDGSEEDDIEFAMEAQQDDDQQSQASSLTSRGGPRDIVSTVTFTLARVNCFVGSSSAGSTVTGSIDDYRVSESGRQAQTGAAPDETKTKEFAKDRLVVFRVEVPPASIEDKKQSTLPITRIETRVLRPVTESLLMSSLVNLADLFEDEVAPCPDQVPTTYFLVHLLGEVGLTLDEDRPCTNLTCPGDHAKICLGMPTNSRLVCGEDAVIRLLPGVTRTPRCVVAATQTEEISLPSTAAVGVQFESNGTLTDAVSTQPVLEHPSAFSTPSSSNASLRQPGNSLQGPTPDPGPGGYTPSPEVLTHYYQENVKLREKVNAMRRDRSHLEAELAGCRLALEDYRRERDALATAMGRRKEASPTLQGSQIASRNRTISGPSSSDVAMGPPFRPALPQSRPQPTKKLPGRPYP